MNVKENAFVEYSQLRALTREENRKVLKADRLSSALLVNEQMLNMQDIVNVILKPKSSTAQTNLSIINQSFTLRKLFNEALQELANYTCEIQVAADSKPTKMDSFPSNNDYASMSRKGVGYEMKFVPASEDKTQWFIVVSLDDASAKQKEEGVCAYAMWQQGCSVIHLTHSANGKFQSILDQNDQLYDACFDVSAQWYII